MPAAEAKPGPVSSAERNALLASFAGHKSVALAVSGGADSLALMRLFADWRGEMRKGPEINVFTVDHGLRPEGAGEAVQVGRWARELGLSHRTLTWAGKKPKRNIQAEARAARYRLIAGACHTAGIGVLATAHHLEDQAETVLLRLARGSGVDGLAAMEPESEIFGLTVARPLLDLPRARLRATLEAAGQDWIEDPSNDDQRYARVRMRGLADMLAAEGLTSARLAATAKRMARARAALDAAADSLSDRSLQLDPAGFCRLELAPLVGAPQETGLRLLARVVMAIGGQGYRPRLERLERLYAMLVSGEGAATLGGCRIAASGGEALVWRESGRGEPREMEIAPGSSALWDGRFRISVSRRLPAPVHVRPLGQEGWRAVREAGARPGLPKRVGPACISFWRGEDMVAAPHALAEGPQGGEYQAEFVGLAGMAREVR